MLQILNIANEWQDLHSMINNIQAKSDEMGGRWDILPAYIDDFLDKLEKHGDKIKPQLTEELNTIKTTMQEVEKTLTEITNTKNSIGEKENKHKKFKAQELKDIETITLDNISTLPKSLVDLLQTRLKDKNYTDAAWNNISANDTISNLTEQIKKVDKAPNDNAKNRLISSIKRYFTLLTDISDKVFQTENKKLIVNLSQLNEKETEALERKNKLTRDKNVIEKEIKMAQDLEDWTLFKDLIAQQQNNITQIKEEDNSAKEQFVLEKNEKIKTIEEKIASYDATIAVVSEWLNNASKWVSTQIANLKQKIENNEVEIAILKNGLERSKSELKDPATLEADKEDLKADIERYEKNIATLNKTVTQDVATKKGLEDSISTTTAIVNLGEMVVVNSKNLEEFTEHKKALVSKKTKIENSEYISKKNDEIIQAKDTITIYEWLEKALATLSTTQVAEVEALEEPVEKTEEPVEEQTEAPVEEQTEEPVEKKIKFILPKDIRKEE